VFISQFGVFRFFLPQEDVVVAYSSNVENHYENSKVFILGQQNVYFPVEHRGYTYYSDCHIEYVPRQRLFRGLKKASIDWTDLTRVFDGYKARKQKFRRFRLTRIPHPDDNIPEVEEAMVDQLSSNDSVQCVIL
jgi:hypothetical protein